MIYIEGLKENIINLNDNKSQYEFNVISKDSNGKTKAYDIDVITNDSINIHKYGDVLSVEIEIGNILKEEKIILTNVLDEKLEIKVIPNAYCIMDKTYKFKITKKIFQDDGSLKIKILSMVNNMETSWRCTYDGKPMRYVIDPLTSQNSCYVTIKPNVKVLNNFTSLLEFTQLESGETIRLNVYNTPEGIKKKVD